MMGCGLVPLNARMNDDRRPRRALLVFGPTAWPAKDLGGTLSAQCFMLVSHGLRPARVAAQNDYVKRLKDPMDDLSQVEKSHDAVRRIDE